MLHHVKKVIRCAYTWLSGRYMTKKAWVVRSKYLEFSTNPQSSKLHSFCEHEREKNNQKTSTHFLPNVLLCCTLLL